MLPVVYAVSFIISVIALIYVLAKRKIYDVYHLMLSVTVCFCNFGYLMVSLSRTVEEAILATKISYLGCFLPFFLFMVIAKICKFSISKLFSIPMAVCAALVYLCVLSIGYSDIYYVTTELQFTNGGAVLIRTYGFAHTLYSIMIIGYMAATTVLILLSFRRKKIVSHITVSWLGILMITSCLSFGLQKLLSFPLELVPIAYAINCSILVYWLGKSDMYDVSVNLMRAREEYNRVGYLVFSRNQQYCGADEMVKAIYPEISNFYIDKPITPSDSSFYHDIATWFYKNASAEGEPNKIVQISDRYYKVSLQKVRTGKKNRLAGYLLEFADVTTEQLYIKMLDGYNDKLEQEVKNQTKSIRQIQRKIILGIATIVESRDSSTGSHIKRTSDVVSIFAAALRKTGEFSDVFLSNVTKAAPMHDIGKISVDDRILRKQGKYTPNEYAEMQKHSSAGAEIVRQILDGVESPDFVNISINIAHYHHEKWDGSGYPCRLSGQDIPPEARIMALADVFDALVSKRCYKEAYSYEKAFTIIRDSLGTHFDPYLGSLFIGCREELIRYYDTAHTAQNEAIVVAGQTM